MSSRAIQKAELRARREAAEERERAEAARRKRVVRLWALAGVLALAVGLLAGVGLDGGGGSGAGAGDGGDVAGAAEGAAMLEGIPQDGTLLGDPKAKLVLTEFADLQCPYCRDYALQVLPQVVERYVRPGRLRLDLKLLRFIGPDSVRGAQAAMAAAAQDRLWHFADLWYRNQGTENTGYARDGFIEDVGSAAGVMNPLGAVAGNTFETQLAAHEAEAQAADVESTPSFLLDGRRLSPESLTIDAFAAAIDEALAK
jgi:protein-disulfide isomerase